MKNLRNTVFTSLLFLVLFVSNIYANNNNGQDRNIQESNNHLNAQLLDSLTAVLNRNLSLAELLKQLQTFTLDNQDVSYFDLLHTAGEVLIEKKKYKSALPVLKELLNQRDARGNNELLLTANLMLSESYNEEHLPDSAALFLDKAEKIYAEHPRKRYEALIITQRASIFDLRGESLEAIKEYQKLVNIYLNDDGEASDLTEVYSKISILHTTLRNYEDACLYMDKAIAICENQKLYKALVGFYINRGTLEHEFGNFEKARP
ncbi:tetratricopeptide repeat protein [Mariniphaga sediminis]|uniref:tetratricopeptide repeat protein n=1 Tax=Mariniphaga sediminis TaxID=1628158 RepID=UPI00356398AF